MKIIDLTGQKFERLTALTRYSKDKRSWWHCQCDCGNTREAAGSDLIGKRAKSCGCYQIDISTVHGHAPKSGPSRTWLALKGAKARCHTITNKAYKYYGARGIKVCDRWRGKDGFKNFLNDMGECPPEFTLERIDNNGNYCLENCKWATREEQARNRRMNIYVIHNGIRKTLTEIRNELGLTWYMVKKQYQDGSLFNEQITLPSIQ